MQNILACLIFWWAIGAFSRPPLGISMPYALWHCCLLCWGLQVTIYFDKFMVFMLIVPSWRWSSGGAHSIDLTRGWCPLNIEIDVQASKLVASGTFGAICYSFACCCFCYLSPRSVHTASRLKSPTFAFWIVLLHPSPGFGCFTEQDNKKSKNHFLCPFQLLIFSEDMAPVYDSASFDKYTTAENGHTLHLSFSSDPSCSANHFHQS